MRLFYCDHLSNFGDAINAWLWPQLLPGMLDDNDEVLFVGIGTILSDRLPAYPRKLVFGSGAGYGAPPVTDQTWSVYCVRGPLTARVMGLPQRAAIADPAILVRAVCRPRAVEVGASYMPHYLNASRADWAALCREAGLHYIDPTEAVEDVIASIAASRLLITDALHGAIVADALRVPWSPIRGYPHILDFKWRDWCASLNMSYAPVALPALSDAYTCGNSLTRLRLSLKTALMRQGIRHRRWSEPRPLLSSNFEFDQASHILSNLKSGSHAMLSRDTAIDSATDRLLNTLEYLKREITLWQSQEEQAFA